jgi:LEA14-like dessication related protein
MKIFKIIILVFISLIVGLMIIGFIWKDDFFKEVLPDVEKIKLAKIAIRDDNSSVQLELVIQNKKYINYHLKSLELDVYNDSLSLLHYSIDSGLLLNRNEKKIIELQFLLPIKKIIKRVKKLQNIDSTDIRISGWAIFSTVFGDLPLHIDERKTVVVPRLITAELEEIKYHGKKNNKYILQVKVKVNNPNDEKMEIKNITYDLYGEDLFEIHGAYQDQISLKAMSHEWLTFPVQVEIEDKVKLISKMIFNKDIIQYRFTMKGKIESMGGIDEEIPLTVNTKGKIELLDKKRKNKFKFTLEKKHPKKKKKH